MFMLSTGFLGSLTFGIAKGIKEIEPNFYTMQNLESLRKSSVEGKALWVMSEYENQETRDHYIHTEHKSLSGPKELSAFFWWLIYQVCTSKNENGLVITEVNRVRAEQKLILEGARKHEEELCAGIPEEDL